MPVYDREIPVRSGMNLDLYSIWQPNGIAGTAPPPTEYRRRLERFAFGDRRRFLAFKSGEPSQNDGFLIPNSPIPRSPSSPTRVPRRLSHLTTFGMMDNWRLNVMDWGSHGLVAMGLRNRVYLLNPDDFKLVRFMSAEDGLGSVTSLAWSPDGTTLAIGLSGSVVQLWDLETFRWITDLESPGGGAITSLCWNGNNMCSFGREDGSIIHCDFFSGISMSRFGEGHASKVCSLRWSTGGTQLASGSNDGLLRIWDLNTGRNLHKFRDEQASNGEAVRGLTWSPGRSNVLASAAGSSIELWNTATGSRVCTRASASRVTGLAWSHSGSMLLSSHWSQTTQFTIWKSDVSLARMDETLNDVAKTPVLSMCQSTDGSRVITLEANRRSLHCWKISENHETRSRRDRQELGNAGGILALGSHIRYELRTFLKSSI